VGMLPEGDGYMLGTGRQCRYPPKAGTVTTSDRDRTLSGAEGDRHAPGSPDVLAPLVGTDGHPRDEKPQFRMGDRIPSPPRQVIAGQGPDPGGWILVAERDRLTDEGLTAWSKRHSACPIAMDGLPPSLEGSADPRLGSSDR